jgi:uncharacterized caspase-like protein
LRRHFPTLKVSIGVHVNYVETVLPTPRKLKLVVLGACRDNPFLAQTQKPSVPAVVASASASGGGAGTRSLGQSLGPAKGLAPVKASSGTLVFFAAKEGQAALDGDGDDSPFAVAML